MKLRSRNVDGTTVYFSSHWILDLENELHFLTYFEQARSVYRHVHRKENIIEVGPGNGLLSDLLRRRGWQIKTLDIDKEKEADYYGDVLNFDFGAGKFDVILAFEVFEHMPWQSFSKFLERLRGAGIAKIIFSIPRSRYNLFTLTCRLPRLQPFTFGLSIPRYRIHTPTHFWELSRRTILLEEKKRLVAQRELTSLFNQNAFGIKPLATRGPIQFFLARRIAGESA
ncbi:MAG: class I SAM-dependent methyltransferase [Oceanipulchritudo sp.]|jgi:hypothetical protein